MRDVLGQVLEETRLRGRAYCQTSARPPWGIEFERTQQAVFHLVTRGTCWLFVGRARQQLSAGDLVLVSPETTHALADHAGSRRVPLRDWLAARKPGESRLGGTEGSETRVLCGVYEFDHTAAHPILRLLPKTTYLPARSTRDRTDLSVTVAALAREYESGGRGASLVVSRLLEVLFVQAVRAWADEQPPGGAGWIGALRDPTLARTLALLHEDLARPWDVAALARVAGTSRATLGRRFSTEVGEPPLAYLTRARMLRAARSLESTDEGLAAIAREVGYTSEFAFSRAFRREFGVPPGEYRKRQAESPRASRQA